MSDQDSLCNPSVIGLKSSDFVARPFNIGAIKNAPIFHAKMANCSYFSMRCFVVEDQSYFKSLQTITAASESI